MVEKKLITTVLGTLFRSLNHQLTTNNWCKSATKWAADHQPCESKRKEGKSTKGQTPYRGGRSGCEWGREPPIEASTSKTGEETPHQICDYSVRGSDEGGKELPGRDQFGSGCSDGAASAQAPPLRNGRVGLLSWLLRTTWRESFFCRKIPRRGRGGFGDFRWRASL